MSFTRRSLRYVLPFLVPSRSFAVLGVAATIAFPGCRRRTYNESDFQAPAPLTSTKDTSGGSSSTGRPLSSLPRWSIGARVLDAKSESFESYAGDRASLAMSLPVEPVKPLVPRIEAAFGVTLKPLGEARITVLTAPEAGELAKAGLGMQDIEREFASGIQAIPYEVLCVGEAVSTKDSTLKAYYLVVRSAGLVDLRARILAMAKERAGSKPVKFEPEAFYPHVTVGFTRRDLDMEDDGVRKDGRTCKYALAVEGSVGSTPTPAPTPAPTPTPPPTPTFAPTPSR